MQNGKCWELRAGRDYTFTRDGRNMLFFDDKKDQTDPFYQVIQEKERQKSK